MDSLVKPVAAAAEGIPPITFQSVAKSIIKKSIRSAVCIDDMFIQPYMSEEEIREIEDAFPEDKHGNKPVLNKDIPRSLYHSFRKEGECDLDIYHFKSYEESWTPNILLNNKDLLVIDWELDSNRGHDSTIKIIGEVVSSDKVPFIIIYTQKPVEEFIEISEKLILNFNFYSSAQIESNAAQLKESIISLLTELKKLSNEEIDTDEVQLFIEKEEVFKNLQAFITTPSTHDIIFQEIINDFCQTFNIDVESVTSVKRKFTKTIKKTFEPTKFFLEYLYYNMVGSNLQAGVKISRINTPDFGFKINNTIITIFSKPGLQVNATSVTPENVYNKFSSLISSSPHNFITLLSIEMRDRLKEDIRKIGVDIASINEKAFFKHMSNYSSANDFFDFLLKSWINDLSEYNLNLKPHIFSIAEQYKRENNLEKVEADKIEKPLAQLGYKLSTVTVPERLEKDSKIRFGDIFEVSIEGEEGKAYFLSLTPHCVCVNPSKIENNFYFIKAKSHDVKLGTAIKKIEIDYYSFIKVEGEIVAIEWDCKPYTLYIENNDLNDLKSNFKNKAITLKYVTTLKESFAQRIANESFNYGTKIGIDLPH